MENKKVIDSPSTQGFESPKTLIIGSPSTVNLENCNSEGFQFSFNEASREDCKGSWDPSPSPGGEKNKKESLIVVELSSLQNQIQAINSKLEKNIQILKEKEQKNNELKKILQIQELKNTSPTDDSYIETYCSCNEYCKIQ